MYKTFVSIPLSPAYISELYLSHLLVMHRDIVLISPPSAPTAKTFKHVDYIRLSVRKDPGLSPLVMFALVRVLGAAGWL